MPLPKPNLDDRTFQQIVDETKRMIPRYCPEWTDHNVSDPGVTLIELFAWMVEGMLYQLNRVPEKTYITLLELLGVTLRPPEAATARLMFRLSAPATTMVPIPQGCKVGNQALDSEPAVDFYTDTDLLLFPAECKAVLTSSDGVTYSEIVLSESDGQRVFSNEPRPGESFYLVYDHSGDKDLSNHVLALHIECKHAEGTGVDPTDPPLTWEAYCKHGQWVQLEVERDTTLALNQPGVIELYMPPDLRRLRRQRGTSEIWEGYWVRCRYNPSPLSNKFRYKDSPELLNITSATVGGLVQATHATPVVNEILGYSSGQPGQVFQVARPPILPRVTDREMLNDEANDDEANDDEVIEVSETPGQWKVWRERANFGASKPSDLHVVIDRVSGEVRFGPRIRERDGRAHQLGAIPPRGSAIRFRSYRSGGGAAGNVTTGKLTVLKDAIAYVERVTNIRPATGGKDAETIEAAQLAAPKRLARTRAVTAGDFEFLAKEAAPDQIGRAYCVEPILENGLDEPPTIMLYIVAAAQASDRRLDIESDLTPDADLLEIVRNYVHKRRLLTTRVHVRAPQFRPLDIAAALEIHPSINRLEARRMAFEALNRLMNPFTGGPDGTGWPFDRPPYQWEVEHALARIPGVIRVVPRTIRMQTDNRPVDEVAPTKGVLFVAGNFSEIEFKVRQH